jgi:hypothetical protein
MAEGGVKIVTVEVVRQKEDNEYVITAVPAPVPVTKPVPEPTVAILLLLLDHAPNAVTSV